MNTFIYQVIRYSIRFKYIKYFKCYRVINYLAHIRHNCFTEEVVLPPPLACHLAGVIIRVNYFANLCPIITKSKYISLLYGGLPTTTSKSICLNFSFIASFKYLNCSSLFFNVFCLDN